MDSLWDRLGAPSKLVNTSLIEPREYQVNIINSVFSGKNTLVVLPTGLGKTIIAVFAIANSLVNQKKAIILAPTKPLSEQHYNSLTGLLNIEPERIILLTGTTAGSKRAEMYQEAKVIAATPQTIANDLKAGRLSMEDFGVVVFDECHRAVGKYAYTAIAEACKDNGVQLIGLTASPGSKRDKVDAIITTLGVENIEMRISTDPDVERYVFGKEMTVIHVEKNAHINGILHNLKPVIEEHLTNLYKHGLSPFRDFETMPKGRLLQIGDTIKKIQASNYKYMAMFNYIYLLNLIHAYDLAATEGIYPFVSYMHGLRAREQKSRAVESILKNKNVLEAEKVATDALAAGGEHPKMFAMVEIIGKRSNWRNVIVFAQYRATIKKLVDVLNKNGVSAHGFMGKKDGVTDSQQQMIIEDFRNGKFKVLAATSIAEEGLDIPSVDAVVFYEPVASEIRNIQRKGRAGRFNIGEVVVLVTKGTKDETYHMIGRMKEKRMRELILNIKEQINRGVYGKIQRPNKLDFGQRSL